MNDSLFPDEPLTLVNDVEGGIRYWPHLLDPGLATRWFSKLQAQVPWQSERRPMYDRVVDVPRLLAAYRMEAIPDALRVLQELSTQVAAFVAAPFNSIGLNFYRDGNDSVAMHNDKLHSLARGHPIAIVSLGSPRRMDIRAKDAPTKTIRIELEPGSLLSMSHSSQLNYEHGVPKTRHPVGPRISVVYRVRPH